MRKVVKTKQRFFVISLRPGDRVLVRCRRRRDDDNNNHRTGKTR